MPNPVKKLKDVLPYQFSQEFMDTPAAKLLEVEVLKTYDPRKTPWPGKHKNVYGVWWKLKNGKAVAWNENPAIGWSFPVITIKKLPCSSIGRALPSGGRCLRFEPLQGSSHKSHAAVVKLANALDSKSSGEILGGSSPPCGTTQNSNPMFPLTENSSEAQNHNMRCIGASPDRRTNKWQITCLKCNKEFIPPTTMLAKNTVECPKCESTMIIDYNELKIKLASKPE